MHHSRRKLLVGLLGVAALAAPPAASAFAAPPAATAFVTAIIGQNGGVISGFGISATFAPKAVSQRSLVVLTNWPNGLDVTPPKGRAVKTFGLQVCSDATGTPTQCTSEFGNYANAPGGMEWIAGMPLAFLGGAQPGVNFGTLAHKLVSISVRTGGANVYIYNPNGAAGSAYPKLLPSSASAGVLTFSTFQPIVWVVTSPSM